MRFSFIYGAMQEHHRALQEYFGEGAETKDYPEEKRTVTTNTLYIIQLSTSITIATRIQKYKRMLNVELQHNPCKPPYNCI